MSRIGYLLQEEKNFQQLVTSPRTRASNRQIQNNKDMQVEIIVPVTLFISIAVVLYSLIQARNRERMAMIEKGFDASLLNSRPDNRTGKFGALKVGIAAVGVGLGFLVGSILESATTLDDEAAYFSMIALFGGLGLIIYYMIVRQKEM